jgi:Na+/H+-dicarboxylate symporter
VITLRDLGVQGTATNVAGQAVVPILVAAREKTLDRDAYDNPTGDLLATGPVTVAEPAIVAA